MIIRCGWCDFKTEDVKVAANHAEICNHAYVQLGYAETLDCMNRPKDWDVPGMIADMAENLRRGNEVSEGQLLAALDWMTFRLRESASAMRDAKVTDAVAEVLTKLKGF
jgi:hypothetical protein